MKKLLLSSVLLAGVTATGVTANAAGTQTIDGESTGDITVQGIIGSNNTDPDSPLPEANDDWINVTTPTDTIFIGTSSDQTITSPDYTITNNSGRPVTISASSFVSKDSSGNLTGKTGLNVNLKSDSSSNIPLITDGTLTTSLTSTPGVLGILANTDGNLKADASSTGSKTMTFGFNGTFDKSQFSNNLTENFTLTLKFAAVDWTK